MDWVASAAAFAGVFAATLAGTGALVRVLRRRAILDHPTERSSHAVPTPRGGGIAVMGVLLPAWAVIALAVSERPAAVLAVVGAALVLAVVSWRDDLGGLSPLWRLAAHFAAAVVGISVLPDGALVFQGLLPLAWDRVAAVLAWVWFVNLFNFMDGIDGITGTEAACIGGGLFLVAAVAGVGSAGGPEAALCALTAAAAALGFLWWNWAPARLFIGDVGSVPLGFLLAWLLLDAAAAGQWAAALILPLYYLADATITLLRRLLKGERIWQAHARHFYQGAVRRGLSHADVVRAILWANLGLVGLAAAAAAGWPLPALAGAAVVVAGLLAYLARCRGDAAAAASRGPRVDRRGAGPGGAGGGG